ncbi:hypothetical protein [Lysinibacillus piscis]|uniref:Phage tail protein n=1 Tax=Lysinibacillus piscis TaxID=2518931 RepID=A0ABQ5NK91_9BACI|nr:hypothetical protein [Lysinibacillus sp. KH24]GLC88709.1 hypothetical protein LYSBPC_18360 [Lysinibacillus sp. KH24]
MAYEPTIWKNREVEKPRTFTLQDNGDGTTTLMPAEGQINEPGTPIMAANMNKIEEQLVKSDQQASNSWQKGVYNDVDISNLGTYSVSKVFHVTAEDWQSEVNVERLIVGISVSHFSGLIKVTYATAAGHSTVRGGAEVVYNIAKHTDTLYYNQMDIISISPTFAKSYKIGDIVHGPNGIDISLSKAPTARNPLTVKVEMIGTYSIFGDLKSAGTRIWDSGSPTGDGYPWLPQSSGFVTKQGDNTITGLLVTKEDVVIEGALRSLLFRTNNKQHSAHVRFNASDTADYGFEFLRNGKVAMSFLQDGRIIVLDTHDNNYFYLDDLKQSVSNGKTAIANAITQMGVVTSPTAEFAVMAANILNLSNIVSGAGTITSTQSQTMFVVSGLSFKPRAIIFRSRGGNIQAWGLYNSTWTTSEFITIMGNTNNGNVFSVFAGGFDVKVAYPLGTGQFDWWAIK